MALTCQQSSLRSALHSKAFNPVTANSSRADPALATDEISPDTAEGGRIKYEDVVDNSILEKLDKSGFIDGLYK